MLFGWGLRNRIVKDLRKNMGYTAAELAARLKLESIEIKRIDRLKLKDVPEPLRGRLTALFQGDDYDRIPW